ncbi:Ground-like domain containing protein, partial [Brugia malayi]
AFYRESTNRKPNMKKKFAIISWNIYGPKKEKNYIKGRKMFNYLFLLSTTQFVLFGLLRASCNCPSCPSPQPCSSCPPPVICQPKICPPVPVCPILLPQSCPVCIKPTIKTVPIPVVKPIYKIINKPIILNECCKTCGKQCIKRMKRNISNDTIITVNSVCNNKILGEIISKMMTSNLIVSQKLIMKKVTKLLGEYNIFCSTGDLTYSAYTVDFCQVNKAGIVCYAFKNL